MYKPGSKISNAEGLSRLPIEDYVTPLPCPEEVVLTMSALDLTPVTSKTVAFYTSRNSVLSQVRKWILHGWPEKRSLDFQPYTTRKDELSEQQCCVLWGSRVVIPAKCRDTLRKELHESHPGIYRVKSLARSHIWWPKMAANIELCVRNCGMCQESANMPQASALHPWEWPGRPWFRVHMDFVGPIQGKWILVIVDAHSKYIDAHVVSSPSSTVTERMLKTHICDTWESTCDRI